MRNQKHKKSALLFVAIAAFATLVCAPHAFAAKPDVPEKYQRLFKRYTDSRSFTEKALNLISFSKNDVGKSFALVAGISQYPNMPITERELRPAAEDVRKMVAYLEANEFFDEIVVLENKDVTYENLQYFLEVYFPQRLRSAPKSRFLFAYSGHGTTHDGKGYLLSNTAHSVSDRNNAIQLDILRVLLDDVVNNGHHVLALINSCYSGGFLRRSFGGKRFLPDNKGAHAITAGGSNELSWADPSMGSGSIFYEKFFAALDGRADMWPTNSNGTVGDGIVTVDELITYLRNEIQLFTDQSQNPQAGDISRHGSLGGFFFLNRQRQVAALTVPEWHPDKTSSFGGEDTTKLFQTARERYQAGDYGAAFPLYLQAAKAGDLQSMEMAGYMYEQGQGIAQNYDEAIRWYHQAVERGSAWSMNQLGRVYEGGWGVPVNPQMASSWFRKAALAGDAWGMNNLANTYLTGFGIEKDYAQAREWLNKAVELGNARAMANIGYMYEYGLGVKQSNEQAFYWYQKAADAGDSYGMSKLGWAYETGMGVRKNKDAAIEWYSKAAAAGDAWGMTNLGNAYLAGFGIEKDYAQAREWLDKAVELGNARAMASIGYLYEFGLGVQQSNEQAFYWYQKASDAGDSYGMGKLGWAYEQGIGVQKNQDMAISWYLKAADAGDGDAMNNLGLAYDAGRGVAKSWEIAAQWFQKGADAGHVWAMANIGHAYLWGRGIEKSSANALYWLQKAQAAGNSLANANLGYMYETGLGVPRDIAQALRYYEQAAAGGDEWAKSRLENLKQNH